MSYALISIIKVPTQIIALLQKTTGNVYYSKNIAAYPIAFICAVNTKF